MSSYVVDLGRIARAQVAVVGGKAAALGELTRIDGTAVPPGFCVTTAAFGLVVAGTPGLGALLDGLDGVDAHDHEALRVRSAEVRRVVETVDVPPAVASTIVEALEDGAGAVPWAVRSSAAAEDSPTASFAGQHDSSLNVLGADAVLRGVRRCWASTFTDRAVDYRLRRGTRNVDARMAVVVQRMVVPHASGVLFTADPVTGDRTVSCVEATLGLGEALVSGSVDPDVFRVRDGRVLSGVVAAKRSVVRAAPAGGVVEAPVEPALRERPALTDAQVLRLVALGRRVEAQLGAPQDLEWCLEDDELRIVQSRPITTLFPVPDADDDGFHVYLSVGHQQMMTDAMRPLGLSLFQATALPRMHQAAGRLFVDVAPRLAPAAGREALLRTFESADPPTAAALRALVDRGVRDEPAPAVDGRGPAGSVPPDGPPVAPARLPSTPVSSPPPAPAPIPTDPALVTRLVARADRSLALLEEQLSARSGPELVDQVVADIPVLKRELFDPEGMQVIQAAFQATEWLNEHLETWLGERNVADVLTRSAPGNVTSEMGLALLDVADVLRPHPAVVALLQDADDGLLDRLDGVPGGPVSRAAIEAFLDRFGMRCVGEIDITRPRWRERPATLAPVLLGNVRTFRAGESARRFDLGRRQAAEKEREVLRRLRAQAGGEQRAVETAAAVDRLRSSIGYREYPKFAMIRRYDLYRRALVREARRLAEDGVLRHPEDADFLTLQELADAARTGPVGQALIDGRRQQHALDRRHTPPRVLTSDGEVVTGAPGRGDAPAGALVGLAVSAGTVEGRARIVVDLKDARLEPGDVLVTTFTDPSWSPLFVAAAGLVTEVGGLMTHGAVVAREYGLPAVVGVEGATSRIRDGQRIRVHGADGYVVLLD